MDGKFEFKSGLKLVHKKMDYTKSVSIGVFFDVGSISEKSEDNGISHFIEHMLFKGTTNRTAFNIAEDADKIGAQINAFTAKEMTAYYTVSVDEHAEKCMELLSDIVFNSVFSEKEIEMEKGVVLEEISMTEDTPDDLASELLFKAFFGKHPLARPILGTRKNVREFTRERLTSYMKEHYTADNTVISVAGNIEFEKCKDLVEKYFDGNFKKTKGFKNYGEKHIAKQSYCKSFKNLEQSNIFFGFPSFEFASDNELKVAVLNTVFGGGMSSRLFQKIRESMGLCYSVYSYPSVYRNNGFLSVYLGTAPDKGEKASAAVIEEIDKIKKDGISQSEFDKAKEQLKSSLILGQESSSAIMRAYGKYMLYQNDIYDIEKRISSINSLDIKSVNDVIGDVFDYNQMAVSYVGKKSVFEPFSLVNKS